MASNAQAARGARRDARMPSGLPLGHRVPRGRVRWYPLCVREGAERETCAALLRLLPKDLLAECFCVRRERWMKRSGAWALEVVPAWRGWAVAVTLDAPALAKALEQLTLFVEPAAPDGRAWAPIAPEARAWLERSMDAEHVLRASVACIEDGELRAVSGPLVGQEPLVRRVDRHRRLCEVEVVAGSGGFTERLALEVPSKR